jgi:hypothetical protein
MWGWIKKMGDRETSRTIEPRRITCLRFFLEEEAHSLLLFPQLTSVMGPFLSKWLKFALFRFSFY